MEKQRWEESERRSQEVRRSERRREMMQVREKVGKSPFTVFFHWFRAPEGQKVTSLKRRVRSQLARWEIKTCTPLWREAHFQAKMYKTHQHRTTFGSWVVEKVHAVVARSTFPNQHVQSTPGSDHFLEVEMSKKCTPLWREAHFQVIPSQNVQKQVRYNYTTLHYTKRHPQLQLRYFTPHYTRLHYITLHYITLH